MQKNYGHALDPYKVLPKMFQDVAVADMEKLLSESEELKDGGAAMTVYARLQFVEMSGKIYCMRRKKVWNLERFSMR